MILETERCTLREFNILDAESMYLLNFDSEVIQYTGDKPFESVDQAKEFILQYDHYQQYGLGRWTVLDKQSNAFMGWCGLKYTPLLDEYDIGFRFIKNLWNRGYATETAIACIEYGFAQLRLSAIVGRAMSANLPSIKVLEKCGMQYEKAIDFDGEKGVQYILRRDQSLL